MGKIEILPISCLSRFSDLFQHPTSAEGSIGWFQAVAGTTLGSGEEAIIVVLSDEQGVARAALPLVSRRNNAVRALSAPYTTLYAPALRDTRWARVLGETAADYVKGSLRLDAMDSCEPGIAAYLEGLKASGLMVAKYRHFVNRFEPLTDFNEYWNARPSRLRTTVRRKLAQADAASVDFQCYRDPAQIEKAISIYEDIYRLSWKQAEPHPHFIRDMTRKLARDGLVRFGVMTLGGKPVAAQIWLVCGRKATIFKLAHREDSVPYSPGTLLTHWMISTLSREIGLDEIDFGRGDDVYKRDWLKNDRVRVGLIAGNWKSFAGIGTIASQVLPTQLSALLKRGFGLPARIFGPGQDRGNLNRDL